MKKQASKQTNKQTTTTTTTTTKQNKNMWMLEVSPVYRLQNNTLTFVHRKMLMPCTRTMIHKRHCKDCIETLAYFLTQFICYTNLQSIRSSPLQPIPKSSYKQSNKFYYKLTQKFSFLKPGLAGPGNWFACFNLTNISCQQFCLSNVGVFFIWFPLSSVFAHWNISSF